MTTERLILKQGDWQEQLRLMPCHSVHCIITSPPYWGLRDYGVPGQLGLEATPQEYVEKLVTGFREAWRVLRDDGTLWLNLGDARITQPILGGSSTDPLHREGRDRAGGMRCNRTDNPAALGWGLKHKDLVGLPWRVAIGLQTDGWTLRSDIIWNKPNPMPESVTDRPCSAHEYLFLFCKGQSKTTAVKFLDLEPELVHFGRYLGPQASASRASALCVAIATSFFNTAQHKSDFSLPPFYSEEWKERDQGGAGNDVRDLPPMQRVAAYSARLLNADMTTKQFLCEMNRAWCDLGQRNPFLIDGRVALVGNPPSVFVDGDTSIAVNYAGKVSKVDFLHGHIIDTVHTTHKYFYDHYAIKEKSSGTAHDRGNGVHAKLRKNGPNSRMEKERAEGKEQSKPNGSLWSTRPKQNENYAAAVTRLVSERNKRDVWTVASAPYKGAHFATFPPDLVRPCIMAGTSERGCCPSCGAPWLRIVEKLKLEKRKYAGKYASEDHRASNMIGALMFARANGGDHDNPFPPAKTIGWEPSCKCDLKDAIPCTVLDPFCGSGTVGAVAVELGRRAVLIDLSTDYADLAKVRTNVTPGLPLA